MSGNPNEFGEHLGSFLQQITNIKVMDRFEDVETSLSDVDGLFLTCIDPALCRTREMPNNLGNWCSDLLSRAMYYNMPVLAMCQGMQVLNVALGGEAKLQMDAHLLKKTGEWYQHVMSDRHQIYISPGSKLAAILGSGGFVRVNSYHGAGISQAGQSKSLVSSAYSVDDGVVEAVESPNHDWIIGVQWHNEIYDEVPKNFSNIFHAFVERTDLYAQKTRSVLS